jgi:hypothetical protein
MRLYVPLNRQEYEALERLAYAERRRPQDQAAVLLSQTLLVQHPPVKAQDRTTDITTERHLVESARASA